MTQKQKYISKTVQFGAKQLTLYSLDGCTWSTRKDELQTILERHEAEKVTAAHLRGEVVEGGEAAGAAGAAKPAPQIPKKKLPIGGYRKEPLQLPHPAYAVDSAQRKEQQKIASKAGAKVAQVATIPTPAKAIPSKKPAAEKGAAKKTVSAAPKPREGSRPTAKKGAARKRAVA